MAGKKISNLYCWQIASDELNIYLASSRKGAVRVGISLSAERDGLDYFNEIFPGDRIIKDYEMNRSLIGAVEVALRGAEEAVHGNSWTNRDLPIDITSTPFRLKAWKAIARIPFGQTRTYGEVARMIGKPGGARAIGQAMGRNPLPLVFP